MPIIIKIQQFISDFILSLLSLLKIILQSSFTLKLPQISDSSKSCIILGNGPSLKKTLENDFNTLKNNDLMCVNQFANTIYYQQFQPKYYIIQGEQYLIEIPINEDYISDRVEVFNNIVTKTTWDIVLLFPIFAKKSTFWKELIKNNKHISVCYYNPTPIEGIVSIRNYLFKLNLGMPRPHNVFIPSLMLAINMNYKTIFITGADHSWHEQFVVDDHNNFMLTDTHFYTETFKLRYMLKDTTERYHIHDAFRKFYLSFKGYHEIKRYAEYRNVNIFNASYKSYIDAFERKAL